MRPLAGAAIVAGLAACAVVGLAPYAGVSVIPVPSVAARQLAQEGSTPTEPFLLGREFELVPCYEIRRSDSGYVRALAPNYYHVVWRTRDGTAASFVMKREMLWWRNWREAFALEESYGQAVGVITASFPDAKPREVLNTSAGVAVVADRPDGGQVGVFTYDGGMREETTAPGAKAPSVPETYRVYDWAFAQDEFLGGTVSR